MSGWMPPPLAEQVHAVLITPRPDCKLWPSPSHRGYGRLRVAGRNVVIHRLIWEAANGPIPEGLVIDHLCRVRSCCNTEHMELVTPSENSRRTKGVPRMISTSGLPRTPRDPKLACVNGHEYREGSYYLRPDGGRRCRECQQAIEKRRGPRRKTP